jgi:hypothetical protein
MNEKTDEIEAFVKAAKPVTGLVIERSYLPGVVTHLAIARDLAALVLAVEIEDEAEPAPVYAP